MHRVDHPSNVSVLPTLQQQGNPGFFTNGSPRTGKTATVVEQDWLNTIQEEISNVIEGAGLTLDKPRLDQLLLAIQLLVDQRLPPMPFLPLLGGTMQGPIYQHIGPTQPAELTNKNYVDGRDNEVMAWANGQDIHYHNAAVEYANARAIQEADRAQNNAWAWDQTIWDRVNWIDSTQGGIAYYGGDAIFTVPGAARVIEVWCTGAGGGAGGNHATGHGGAGGGAGATAIGHFGVAPGQQYYVMVGAGGAPGGANGAGGSPGGASQFGDLLGATGGGGGGGSTSVHPAGADGGTGYGTGLMITGGMGTDGWRASDYGGTAGKGGDGGASFWGGGGRAGAGMGFNGRALGSGGGGAYSAPGVGGWGTQGLVFVRWNR